MCFYVKHQCPCCPVKHLIFSYACEDGKGEAACGVQEILNDQHEDELGAKPCPSCLKAQYPFDATRDTEHGGTNMQIDDSGRELTMPTQPAKGKTNLILPKSIPPFLYNSPKATDTLKILKDSKFYAKRTADIPTTGATLAPIKSPEELTQAEQQRLEEWVSRVKDRKAQEWPEPGETLEAWKARQASFRFTMDEFLVDEWNAFHFLLQQKQGKQPKVAISRLR